MTNRLRTDGVDHLMRAAPFADQSGPGRGAPGEACGTAPDLLRWIPALDHLDLPMTGAR